ncbi:HpcH/HpaI aldolase/citrate lyase family protein [Novosphingobium sp.]|uniref:HpcH/HpaI aldolase/citrate lyase family protein n=1 Tax=Novosphingobium sp. TaxID=1874826 RepID=UPI003B521618
MQAPRSWLFIPADSDRKLAKARDTGAHALILDLEDAVTADRKPAGRAMACDWLRAPATADQPVWVRINATDTPWWRDDLAAIVAAAPAGVMVPKAGGPDDIAQISALIDDLERAHGLAPGQIRLLPLVSETARAAITIPDYARAALPRLAGLTWGAEDLGAALGVTRRRTVGGAWTDAFRLVRAQTLLTAHALECWAIDTLHADFRDEAGLAQAAAEAAADGFTGMLAIHPAQVAIINRAFAPDDAALAEARAIVAAFADNPGVGALQIDGRMIDQPHLRQARALLGLG